jgi:hypothetical protein
MGTSVNQASPRTRNWEAAQSTYKSDAFPVERVLQEVWRAATNQPEGDLAAQLAAPIVSRLRDIALQGATPVEVATAVNREIAQSRQASLGVEIARRAAVQCLGAENRAQAFNERVFAEASNYLVSRDLPGFVGANFRNQTVADSHQFKQSVLDAAARTAREVSAPRAATPDAWRRYAAAVVDRLRRYRG